MAGAGSGEAVRGGGEAANSGGRIVNDLVISVFRLNGILLAVGGGLARPAGLSAARWQVLAALHATPLSVAGIAREMGLTRQSVQRIANLLVDQQLAEYVANPAPRRAKLLAPTPAGRAAIRQVAARQHVWAEELADRIGEPSLRQALQTLDRVIVIFDPTTAETISDE